MSFASGTLLQQRYRIDRRLGQGGFGTVYQAYDIEDERPCALKCLTRIDSDSIAQFEVEAELLRRIRSPRVPRMYDAFPLAASQGRVLVMEYIDGETLGDRLARSGPLPEVKVLTIALHILEALMQLHSQERPIIHRDIKPDNLKLDADGNTWLLDLGIGKPLDQQTTRAAKAATLAYAPLEQLQFQPTNQRSDLFALGATLYHLVTGQLPESTIERMTGSLTPPADARKGVSDALSAIIVRAMQMNPADRFTSAFEMHREVELLLDPDLARREIRARRLRDRISRGQPQSIRATHVLPPQHAVFRRVSLPGPLDRAVRDVFGQPTGDLRLYSHQAESLERARKRKDIIVVTGTASGKSMCFNLPVLERCIQDPRAHALYLFPIKALINDQTDKLEDLGRRIAQHGGPNLGVARLHGDLNDVERQAVRRTPPRIALSNPDFVHWMLARHTDWRALFTRLQFIVLDEVHVYRGMFGSHVAMLLRRLQRICAHYGATPQFICCSATVSNPLDLAQRLTGRDRAFLIDRDGADRVRRHVHFWEPLAVGEGQRRAVDEEAITVTTRAVEEGQQVITFARARQEVEQLLARSRTAVAGQSDPAQYSAYRGGYTRKDREQIEQALRDTQLRAIYSTSALEMGIDIGSLQMSVLTGFPGSKMSFWQQAGRAGRKREDAHVFLIGGPNPLDAYYLARPETLLYGPSEMAVVDLDNQYIARGHLQCMAREWPIQQRDIQHFREETRRAFESLTRDGSLVEQTSPSGYREYAYSGADLPHSRVSLRSVDSERYEIVCPGRSEPLGEIGPPQLYREAHPKALYYYLGEDFRVETIDEINKQVIVKREPVQLSRQTRQPLGRHVTRPMLGVSILTQHPFEIASIGTSTTTATCSYGSVRVVESVEGYRELWLHNLEKIGEFTFVEPLRNKPLDTKGLWLDINPTIQSALFYDKRFDLEPDENGLRAALHGLEHLLLSIVPTVALCDRRDLGSQYVELFGAQESVARIYIYDPVPGGVGLAERAYRNIPQLLHRAYEVVSCCMCKAGCPYCVHASWCYQENKHVDKQATLALLEYLLELPVTL
ncbi:MAG: hypothetical protein RLZZ387_2091 [Chloroflexota bacterium]|jgi:DEAD/DEAH box helicase domain-containing protein